jgi:hypothetical protein
VDFIRHNLNTMSSEVQLGDQNSVFGARTGLILKMTLRSECLFILYVGMDLGLGFYVNPCSFHASVLKRKPSINTYLHCSACLFTTQTVTFLLMLYPHSLSFSSQNSFNFLLYSPIYFNKCRILLSFPHFI